MTRDRSLYRAYSFSRPTKGAKSRSLIQIAVRMRPETFAVVERIARHRNQAVGSVLRDMIETQLDDEFNCSDLPDEIFKGWDGPT